MRAIKFRGLYEGTWVYGNLIRGRSEGTPFTHIEIADSDDWHQWQVNDESVGQFTGLKDKNGVEIYEGDVVKCRSHRGEVLATVVYEMTLGFGVRDNEGAWQGQLGQKIAPQVIGNIYESPELLNKEATANA